MFKEFRRRAVYLAVFLLLVGAIYFVYRGLHFPLRRIRLDVSLSQLPFYASDSLLRMIAAYGIAFFFSVAYGSVAALFPRWGKFMVPVLDILQSVPVLGFFPAAVFFFVNLFQGSRAGVEVASVFLIFTSMAWNMAFGVYESLTTIPQDSLAAAESIGIRGFLKFRRIFFPVCIPKLVYNSMISWAGGWSFLIACEIIAIGPVRFHLPGLGSYLIQSTEEGRLGGTLIALLVLVLMIVFLDLFVWRPLSLWAEKFRYEFTVSSVSTQNYFVLRWIRRIRSSESVQRAARRLKKRFVRPWQRRGRRISAWVARGGRSWEQGGIWALRLLFLGFLIGAFYALVGTARAIVSLFQEPLAPEAWQIPLALLASFCRLLVAYFLSVLWTLPAAIWVGENRMAFQILTPLAQIGASIPATALFPLFVFAAVHYLGGMNVASILLVLTGMQWYLLFNLIAGVRNIPGDLKEAARALGLTRWRYWRTLYLPAVFPSLITGSITAWGGGWNALIVSEYIVYKHDVYSVLGIGAVLDEATYGSGNFQVILLSLMSMIVVITLLNRLFWRPLYLAAAERYKIEY
jgi:NitT/TauT family transport system permease protein